MNKYKLLVAVAVAGLFGLSARASISGFDSVNIKCTILMQTNDTYPNANTTKFNVTKMKVTNKDILNLIAPEFATNAFSIGYTTITQDLRKSWNVLFSPATRQG